MKDRSQDKMAPREIPETDNYCAFCEYADELHGNEYVLCEKKGVVSATWCCRKFRYDPLKRLPAARKAPTLEYIDIDL